MSFELQLLLLLALIILVAKFAGHFSKHLGLPTVFGVILVGVIIGPAALNMLAWLPFAASQDKLHEMLKVFANLGVLLLMFIAGLETDIKELRRVGGAATWAAILGVLTPLAFGVLLARAFGMQWGEAFFIGAVLTATSISISAQTLMEMSKLDSRAGMTILGAAVIDDILGIIVLSFVVALATPGGVESVTLAHTLAVQLAGILGMPAAVGILQIVCVLLLMVLFFALALSVGKNLGRLLAWAEKMHATHIIPATALFLLLLFSLGAEYLGQVAAITGAYLAGVMLARTKYHVEILHAIAPFTYALFVPIFLVNIGLGVEANAFTGGNWTFIILVILVAVVTKVIGCFAGAKISGFSSPDAWRVGVGMISRGEVGLIIAQVGREAGLLGAAQYTAMIIMVLATTMITPVLLRLSWRGETT
ncbi:MAG: cation:proton antiporter [bacterium]